VCERGGGASKRGDREKRTRLLHLSIGTALVTHKRSLQESGAVGTKDERKEHV
jgi:hypothetical protein